MIFFWKKFANRSFPLFWWAMRMNRSGRSPKMSDHERFAQVADKNEQMSESLIFLSKLLIHSFLGKKRAICSENRWANSQPWNEAIKNIPSVTVILQLYVSSIYFACATTGELVLRQRHSNESDSEGIPMFFIIILKLLLNIWKILCLFIKMIYFCIMGPK